MTAPSARWRAIALGSIAVLLALIVARLFDGAIEAARIFKLAAFCIPLLLPLRGLLRGDRYTFRWATLCVLPYFIVALTEAIANPTARPWAIAMLGLALTWFAALVAFLRVSSPP